MEEKIQHYYGDIVRRLFIAAALIIMVSLPFVADKADLPLFISLFAIIIFGIFAGLTSPRQRWVAVANLIIALASVIVFEYSAVLIYLIDQRLSFFFWINQILALIFFSALYYAVKTARGLIARQQSSLVKPDEQEDEGGV